VLFKPIVQALQGEPITVYGDGTQPRSFCYADDVIDGMMSLMDSDKDLTDPINIGNPGEVTMVELAKKKLRMTQSKSKLVFMPPLQDDPRCRQPDIAEAQSKLGWAPKVSLEDGLRETIAYSRKTLNSD
jgi:UDP-glucuronate decarboxylase